MGVEGLFSEVVGPDQFTCAKGKLTDVDESLNAAFGKYSCVGVEAVEDGGETSAASKKDDMELRGEKLK